MSATGRFPLSPSSPSETTEVSSTIHPKSHPSTAIPRSPISPPLMSVATKSYVSSYGNNQHTDEMAQRPRSPSTNYMQQPPRKDAAYSSQEPNLKRPSPSGDDDDDEEHRGKRQKIDSVDQKGPINSLPEPTNHERHPVHGPGGPQPASADPQRSQENRSNDPSLERSRQDHGEAFLLCRSTVPRSQPDPNQHLLATYGLGDLLRSVARVDPLSGEKINKLRKSYEGQIKTFQLPGRNKPVKAEKDDKDEPGPLRRLGMVPDERWEANQGSSRIEITDVFREKLRIAMQIQPGKVRNNAQWEDVLGHEKARPNMQSGPTAMSNGRVPNGAGPKPQQTYAAHGVSAGDKRSTRGNRRSYDDDSFVGYGEGYSDGDDVGEDDDNFPRRKRKKEMFGQFNR